MNPEAATPGTPALATNDRSVEVPWALQRVGSARRVLDVGCSTSDHLAELTLGEPAGGRRVYGLDPDAARLIGNAGILKGTIVAPPFPAGSFDLILCISTVEHIGLPIYGQHEFPHGDILAMRHMRRLLAPGGRLLLTVPFGRAQVNPWFRVYDRRGLRWLAGGFRTLSAAFYRLRPEGEGRYEPCRAADLRAAGYDFEHMRSEGVALAELTPSGPPAFLLVRALTRLSFLLDRLRGKEKPFLSPS
jgi:SAM-dependent methyltransferase